MNKKTLETFFHWQKKTRKVEDQPIMKIVQVLKGNSRKIMSNYNKLRDTHKINLKIPAKN